MSDAKVFEGTDWGNGSDRGYMVVSIGPDPTPETVQAFRDAYDLGCAWAEAEAALPEGWDLILSSNRVGGGRDAYARDPYSGNVWELTATGDTEAAALRALAERLKETRG